MNLQEIEDFRRRFGRKADKTIETLAALDKQISSALSSTIGKEVLQDDLRRYDELLFKAAKESLSVDERAEFNYVFKRLQVISNKINDYLDKINKIES